MRCVHWRMIVICLTRGVIWLTSDFSHSAGKYLRLNHWLKAGCRFLCLIIKSDLPSGTMYQLFMQDRSFSVWFPRAPAAARFCTASKNLWVFAADFIKSIIELITLIYLGLCSELLSALYAIFMKQSARCSDNPIRHVQRRVWALWINSNNKTKALWIINQRGLWGRKREYNNKIVVQI